jgi:hypothetical protein
MLEALACREALALGDDLLVGKLIVATDCQQVIKDIMDDAGGCYAPIIKEIGLHRREFVTSVFKHEGRKSDTEAHNLARHALSLGQGRHLWLLETHNLMLIPVMLAFD